MVRNRWAGFVAFLVLAGGFSTGCGDPKDTNDTADSDTQDTEDSSEDTGFDSTPVWIQYHIQTSATLNGIYASGRGVYAIGTGGSFYSYKQATDWVGSEIDVGGEDLNGFWGFGSDETLTFVTVGNAGKLVEFENQALNAIDLGTTNFSAVHGPSMDLLYAVGWGSVYIRQGGTWTLDDAFPGDIRINDVFATSAAVFGVAEDGVIMARLGDTWEKMESPTTNSLYGIWGTSENNIFAVGAGGTVLHYDGTAWTLGDSGTSQNLWAVWAFDQDTAYAVGNNGTAVTFDGDGWTPLPTGVTNNLYAVSCSSETNCWAAGNRGMTLNYNP